MPSSQLANISMGKRNEEGYVNPVLLAVGGGKGGTGKSTVAACLAAELAHCGRHVILADLDFGGANLHTMLGIEGTGRSIVQFLYHPMAVTNLNDCLVPAGIDGLYLLPGDGFMPGIANMEFARKQKLMRALKKLRCDYVVCDLGAGSSFNVIDFFLFANSGILVLTAEATAILNGYEFMKNCIFRKICRYFAKDPEVTEIINNYKRRWESGSGGSMQEMIMKVQAVFPEAARGMQQLCNEFTPVLLLNRIKLEDNSLGKKLNTLSQKYLDIKIKYLGALTPETALRGRILSFLKKSDDSPFKHKTMEVASFFERRHSAALQPGRTQKSVC